MTAQLVYSADLDTSPPEELVKGMLPRGPAVGIAYGPPHCGKSFTFSTELPLMIQAGRQFLGRDVIQGTTVLCLGEGLLGAGVRKAARLDWQARQDAAAGLEGPSLTDDSMLVLTESFPVAITRDGNLHRDAEKVVADLSVIGDLELLVLDSLEDFAKGTAVSNQSAATRLMEGAKQISQRLGCLVLFIHHTTKTGLMLGADRLRAAADVVISVTPEQGGRDCSVVECVKMRYAERFAPFAVEAIPHAFDEPKLNEEGEPTGETFRASSFVTRLRTDAGTPVVPRKVLVPDVPKPARRNGLRPRVRNVPDQLAAARDRKDMIAGILSIRCETCSRPNACGCDLRFDRGAGIVALSMSPPLGAHESRILDAALAGAIDLDAVIAMLAAA